MALSCYIIGDDLLTLECAKHLFENHWDIQGIITEMPVISHWANENGIKVFQSIKDFGAQTEEKTFDYLFSIVNKRILSKQILAYPRCFSINYHASLLPKYAGMNGISYALLNAEKTYGITWHVIEPAIDAGDILKQEEIAIEPDETACSLMTKCSKQAKRSFFDLVRELSTDQFYRMQQSLDDRSYYSLKQLPPKVGFIDWSESAESIDRMSRALDFGTITNTLCAAKVIIGDQICLNPKLVLLHSNSDYPAGHIVKLNNEGIVVSTKTVDVCLESVTDCYGKTILAIELVELLNLKEGKALTTLNYLENNEKLTDEYNFLRKFESDWLKKYKQINFSSLSPLPLQDNNKVDDNTLFFEPPENLFLRFPQHKKIDIMLSLIILYLYRLTQEEQISILYSINSLSLIPLLIQPTAPLSVDIHYELTFLDLLETVSTERKKISTSGWPLAEIFVKHPELAPVSETMRKAIAVRILKDDETIMPLQNHVITIGLSTKENKILFSENSKSLEKNTSYTFLFKNSIGHLQQITSSLISSENELSLRNISLLTEEEFKTYNVWNNTDEKFPEASIYDLFVEKTKTNLNKVALYFNEKQFTYQQIYELSKELASQIKKAIGKAEENEVVAFCIDRSPNMLITMIALLRLNYVLFPLEVDAKKQENVIQKINLYKPKAIISTSESSWIPEDYIASSVKYNDFYIVECKAHNPLEKEEECILLTTTSGTTGVPKGIPTTNLGWTNWVHYLQKEKVIHANDIVYCACPITFDAAFWEIFCLTLTQGASLVLSSEEERLSIHNLEELFSKRHVTMATFTPSVFTQMSPKLFPSLNTVFLIGESLNSSMIESWLKKGRKIFNGYGPSEVTAGATLAPCRLGEFIDIGGPISNIKMLILDNHGEILPIGVWGEIYIGGVGVSPGYVNASEEQNRNFLMKCINESGRYFKTGDRARFLPNGRIEFGNRISNDRQYKIRGVRVELDGMEHVLLEHPNVVQAHVRVIEVGNGRHILIAYLMLKDMNEKSNWNTYLLGKGVPSVALPTKIVNVQHFPFTVNGKLDTTMLYQQTNLSSSEADPIIENPDSLESLLRTICLKVLPEILHPCIDLDTNLFSLGANSLDINEIVSLINQKILSFYHRKFTINDIVKGNENFTINRIAQIIRNKNPDIDKELIKKSEINTSMEMESCQKGMQEYNRASIGESPDFTDDVSIDDLNSYTAEIYRESSTY